MEKEKIFSNPITDFDNDRCHSWRSSRTINAILILFHFRYCFAYFFFQLINQPVKPNDLYLLPLFLFPPTNNFTILQVRSSVKQKLGKRKISSEFFLFFSCPFFSKKEKWSDIPRKKSKSMLLLYHIIVKGNKKQKQIQIIQN